MSYVLWMIARSLITCPSQCFMFSSTRRQQTYHRAPPIGDQHTDLCLCVTCHSGLLDGGAKAAEVMAALDETGVGAAPGMNAFAELTWRPEDEREFDDYVQCTECDRWHHFVCAMYPAPEQMPASWQAVHWSFVCSGCKGAGQAKQITALQKRLLQSQIVELEEKVIIGGKPIPAQGNGGAAAASSAQGGGGGGGEDAEHTAALADKRRAARRARGG